MTALLRCPHCERTFAKAAELLDDYKGLHFSPGHIEHAGGKRHLRPQVMRVLTLLVEADGNLVSYRSLEHALWSQTPEREFPSRNTIRVAKVQLNEALEGSGLKAVTTWGLGYHLAKAA